MTGSSRENPTPLDPSQTVGALGGGWSNNWLWGLPLIVLTIVIHGFGLVAIRERILWRLEAILGAERSRFAFALVVALTVLVLTILHAIEGGLWAIAYLALDASPDPRDAMLYSLSAMTTYGHANIFLDRHWQMMGALEALNGMLLFGLTTAFLFGVLNDHWPSRSTRRAEGA